MNVRLWLLLALAAVALLATGAPVFRDHHGPSATGVFTTILHDSYAGWSGFHVCQPEAVPEHDVCWAELRKGNRHRVVGIEIDMSQANPVPRQIAHDPPWTRHAFHVAAPEGHGTANTMAYGWERLMATVPKLRLPATFFAIEGDRTGYPPEMFSFRCTGTRTLITCRNALADELTFTPNRF